MPDQKPLVDNPRCYSEPMTFFRLQYLKDTEGMTEPKRCGGCGSKTSSITFCGRNFYGRKSGGKSSVCCGTSRRVAAAFRKIVSPGLNHLPELTRSKHEVSADYHFWRLPASKLTGCGLWRFWP